VGVPPHLPQSETELEEFFDLSMDLLCVVGFDGYFKRVNASLERTLGYAKPELFSQTMFDITHPDDVQPSREALGQLAEGRDVVGFESRVICADGTVRWLQWNTRTMPERSVVYGVGRDVTDRRNADAELREAQRLLEASRDELRVLAEEQAALRRVATLVAEGGSPSSVLDAVAGEMEALLDADQVALNRFEGGDELVVLAHRGLDVARTPVGSRVSIEGESATALVRRTGRPARMEDYASAGGPLAELARATGLRASVSAPISVEGSLWGVITASWKKQEPPPPDTEERMAKFTALVATAIANAESREAIGQLAGEQAALRRVATLVAEAVPPSELFDAVVEELGTLLRTDLGGMIHYEADGTVTAVATWAADGEHPPVEGRWSLEGDRLATRIFRTRTPAREDNWEDVEGPIAEFVRTVLGVRSTVGSPIVVEGDVWGAIFVHSTQEHQPLRPDTEARLTNFAELVGTAISNAQARAEVARLADEQAALRRVATLVAQGSPPAALFEAVTGEVAQLLDASTVTLGRYEDDMVTVVAQHGADYVGAGDRFPLGGRNVASIVRRRGRTARLDDVAQATGAIGDRVRRAAARSAVAAPVVVEGGIWGVLAAIWMDRGPPPDNTEERLDRFAKLLDTAVANADSRDQLTASRARVLAASDEARRRVVRDLHDGAQQRLVHTIITLKLAQQALRDDPGSADARLAEALDTAERAMAEVRELAHGILPSVLVHSGLHAGVGALASRLDLPVELDVSRERLPADVEASAYFIVAEALTNVVKHARATRAVVKARVEGGVLVLEVRDDGVGEADPEGHGLVGIADRVDALGGWLSIASAKGEGTALTVRLPVSTGWPRGSGDR
jgi:PAS domain S-box-containing protein